MIKIQTPPLPLPLRGGEWLRRHSRKGPREALPAPQGEGQGWGLKFYHHRLLSQVIFLQLLNVYLYIILVHQSLRLRKFNCRNCRN